jgi:acyl transferase domain-containing protein
MPASGHAPRAVSHGIAGPVAVVGMAAVLPGAGSLEDYWRNLVTGVDAIKDVPPNRWEPELYDPDLADEPDHFYCRRGGFVDEFADFDPLAYGIMPASVGGTEPEQLLALRVASEAIQDAGGASRLPDRDRVGVMLGRLGLSGVAHMNFFLRVRLAAQVRKLLREMLPDVPAERLDLVRQKINSSFEPHHAESVIGLMSNLTASRIANRLDLRGPAYVVDAACASSLIAVEHAIAELTSGRLDVVLAGGVHHNHDAGFWAVFSQLRAMSRQGRSRPFDAGADGLLIGEGTAIVVLKRLADAIADGDRIHAVIRGLGMSSDGRSASLVNPETAGQVMAVRRAWAAAGLDPTAPDALGLLEAHGTGTPVGDAAELATVAEVFGPPRGDTPLVIGSVKSMIGHTMATAGAAGLVKTVLAVSKGMLLPTLNCDVPRPELAGTRFMPIQAAQPWDGPGPRRAAVSAFGFGGINTHVVIEQAPDVPRPRRGSTRPAQPAAAAEVREAEQIVLLAAADHAAMGRLLEADDHAIRAHGTGLAADGAHGADGEGCRLGIVDPTAQRLAAARKVVAAGAAWRGGRDIWFSPRPMLGSGGGRIAFVFPGLEADLSQSVDDVAGHFGLDTGEIGGDSFSGRFIQVMHLAWLLHDALGRMGIRPDAVAGHSLGEWTAGVVAGLVDESLLGEFAAAVFDPALERKDLLHAVISDSAAAVADKLAEYPGVFLSHDNAPAQSVVSGPTDQVQRLIAGLSEQNTLCRPLPFATGIHTPYLEPLIEPLVRPVAARQEPREPRMEVWSATLAAPLPADPADRLDVFLRQLVEPVRFRPTVVAMHDAGFRAFLQVGPGQLASLIHDNLRERDHLAIPVNVAVRSGLAQLRRVATALWVEGCAPDFSALDTAARPAADRPATAARGLTMRLELGTAMPSLGEGATDLLGAATTVTAGARAGSPAGALAGAAHAGTTAPATLNDLAVRSPAATELARLLEDTAGAAASVLSAGQRATPAKRNGSRGHPASQSAAPATRPPARPAGRGEARDGSYTSVLRICLDDMPYLVDHVFFPQPDDWPHVGDRMPVVPACTMIQHMIDAVEAAAPGTRVIQVNDARFSRWVIAEPPQEVEITVRPGAPGEFTVTFGSFARARMQAGQAYPPSQPAVWQHDPATEWPTPLSAERMYGDRILFHGPRYRGVVKVHAIGDRHIRGLLRTPSPPGGLLDAGLQILGNWVDVTLPTRFVVFPTGFDSIQFFGPAPAAGQPIECVGRIPSFDDRQVVADFQLICGGRIWAQATGSTHQRFDSHPKARPTELAPGRNAFADLQPEGWTLIFDYWPYPESTNSVAALTMGVSGYLELQAMRVAERKGWLLSRLAVKDAARFLIWDEDGTRDIFPIEITVTSDADGHARVEEWRERRIPAFEASFAQAGQAAVAIARPAGNGAPAGGLGIGIAVIRDDHADAPPAVHAVQAAKDAVARAESARPSGTPGELTVTATDPAVITVSAGARVYRVSHREIRNPDDMPARRYVVAWTRGPEGSAPR